jgi:hypothetical protein
MGQYGFRISVTVADMPDPATAIEWFMQHLKVSMAVGDLFVSGTGPSGERYLWRPERGKTPEEWLVPTEPAGDA